MDYIAKEIPFDGLIEGLKQLQQAGFKGINVTVPFKEQVWQAIENKSDHASRAGAVNTVVFNDDGTLYGDNTDGIGLCRDLVDNHQIELNGKRLLLLGAGGAARGVIEPLLSYQPTELIIANRTVSKAEDLADLFADFGNLSGCGFEELTGSFDVIINATSASLQGEVPPLADDILNDNASCYDMMYSNEDTAFIVWAKQHGATMTVDGLGMLAEQAAEAFRIWREVKPDTKSIIQEIRGL